MNWYNKILRYSQIVGKEDLTYVEIGHDTGDTDDDFPPNYLWVYADGQLMVEQEGDPEGIEGYRTHKMIWQYPNPDYADTPHIKYLDRQLRGRYESSTGRLSAHLTPEYRRLGGIPTPIKNLLYEKFPGINKFYYF